MAAAVFRNRLTNDARRRAGARIEREPDQAARPIEQGFSVMRAGNRLGDFWSGGWRHGNFPDDFFARVGERLDIADGPPKLLRSQARRAGPLALKSFSIASSWSRRPATEGAKPSRRNAVIELEYPCVFAA